MLKENVRPSRHTPWLRCMALVVIALCCFRSVAGAMKCGSELITTRRARH